MQEVSIDYTYDALNRLTSATYSNGTAFAYTYDAAGNVLTYAATHYSLTTTTTYTYDEANQLLTATDPSATWTYTYDGNGSLIESDPGTGAANGSTRYTYNTAGYLTKLETYTTDWQTQSEMKYDGLGNRLEMTTYVDGTPSTTRYQLDNGQTLAAIAGETSTFTLYGHGVIGTFNSEWSYILQDGAGSMRQLAKPDGVVALSVSYTPWGDTLEVYGTGMLDIGYLGGLYDAGTGLIYMGNGQYYDPSTGRFLTRGANADQSNPYTPWNSDPSGMLIAPLALLALVFGRKKNRTKLEYAILILVTILSVGISFSSVSEFSITTVSAKDSNLPVDIYIPPANNVQEEGITHNGDIPEEPETPASSVKTASALICLHINHFRTPDSKNEDWGWNSNILYKIYTRLYEDKNWDQKWWWKEYGDDGHFSLEEFYATLLIREVAYAPRDLVDLDVNVWVEALARKSYQWCTTDSGLNCDPTTDRGIANFLVSWSSPVKVMLSNCWNSCPLDAYFSYISNDTNKWAYKIIKGIKYPMPEWMVFDKDRPCDSGNVVLDSEPIGIKFSFFRIMNRKYKHEAFYQSPKQASGDLGRLVIPTYCERFFLQNGYLTTDCKLPENITSK